MSYLLCLGFVSFKYKKEPTVRLYFDETFLYEFEINSPYTAKQFESKKQYDELLYRQTKSLTPFYNRDYNHYLKTIDPLKNWNSYKKLVKYDQDVFSSDIDWHFFEIDDSIIHQSKKLHINVESTDSNYTNGFMTLSTTYNLRLAYLIPTNIVNDYKNYFKKYDMDVSQYNRRYNGIETVKHFYKKDLFKKENKNYLNLINEDSIQTFSVDGEPLTQFGTENYNLNWFGGSKNIVCDLDRTRLNVDINCIKNDLLAYDLAYAICNKYTQHENQRSDI